MEAVLSKTGLEDPGRVHRAEAASAEIRGEVPRRGCALAPRWALKGSEPLGGHIWEATVINPTQMEPPPNRSLPTTAAQEEEN